MSDVRFTPVDEVERETAREPAKRWRNKYRVTVWCARVFDELDLDGNLIQGEHWGRCTWASHEVAEQRALEIVTPSNFISEPSDGVGMIWLGAFPEEST